MLERKHSIGMREQMYGLFIFLILTSVEQNTYYQIWSSESVYAGIMC